MVSTGIVKKAGWIDAKDGNKVYLVMIELEDSKVNVYDFVEVRRI